MAHTILHRDDLPQVLGNYEFEGYLHGDSSVSFIWVDQPPGHGPRLHKHPYEEIFILLEGRGRYTVGTETLEATAGQIIVVPPNTPHKFINSGEGQLRQIDIHASKQFITEWLED
ncbi:MAG TPA: cupin domain-containing protein [Ktedonobacterales bacterium]|nr:cupin domain-containing protein [Ktedonobacterales bacterium]